MANPCITFYTLKERHCFLHMPYGIYSTNNVYHSWISQMFEDINGSADSQDDIIICGEDIQDLESVWLCSSFLDSKTSFLESLRKHCLELSKSKCHFSKSKINFLRHRVISTDIFPNEREVKSIIDITYPISLILFWGFDVRHLLEGGA